MIIEMESTENGVHYRSDTTEANGTRLHAEYTANYAVGVYSRYRP
jgi:hypothetical protein